MKLITVLGTGKYEPVTYRWNDHTCKTSFVQEAFVRWLKPEVTCVMLTEKAQKEQWQYLRPLLETHTGIVEIDIPDGKSKEELWQIFTAISDAVHEGDEIAFDITHGFRSLPVLALLTIAYLKQIKQVRVRYILYGAFEARDAQDTPVFDLTPFADLLDWLVAAKMFTSTGDSSELGQLIQQVQNDAYRNRGAYGENLPRALKNFGMALEEVSNDLLLARVPNLPDSIRKLAQRQSEADTEVGQWTPPLTLLLDKIAAAYAPFQDGSLPTQAALIRWYLEHNHIVQAVTLAREWVVSDYAQQKSLSRDDAEAELNQRAENHEKDEIIQLWNRIREFRNDLAHCGFGRAEGQVLSAASICQNAKKVVDDIERLAQQGVGR